MAKVGLESLLTEDNFLQIDNKFESLLYEFVAAPEIVNKEFIKIVAKSADIDVSKIDEIVELLCNATFLAREVSTNRYEFSFDEDQTEKLKVMSRKLCDKKGTIPRYKIHNAFHTYLEINKI